VILITSSRCSILTSVTDSLASIAACPRHVRSVVDLGNADCPVLPVEGIRLDVIQAPRELRGADRPAISAGLDVMAVVFGHRAFQRRPVDAGAAAEVQPLGSLTTRW
jgi:hypothetical protein